MNLSTQRLQEIIDEIEQYVPQTIEGKNIPLFVLKLQKKFPHLESIEIGSALEQIVLRKKGQEKFLHATDLMFVSQSLEQATHWKIAQYIASQLQNERVVDLTAGMGGDALMFAESGVLSTVVESNDEVRQVLKYNLRRFAPIDVLSSWESVPWEGITVAYLDPNRRDAQGNVLRSLRDWQPDLQAILPELLTKVSKIVVKISPAFQESDLELLPDGWSLEVISYGTDLKQAMLWYGFDRVNRSATVIGENDLKTFPHEAILTQCDKGEGIFYPYPGLRRAGLEEKFFAKYDMVFIEGFPKLGKGTVSKELVSWGRWYEQLAIVDGSLLDLRKILLRESIDQVDVIFLEKVSVTSEMIYRKIKAREGGGYVVFVSSGKNGKYLMMLAKRKRGM